METAKCLELIKIELKKKRQIMSSNTILKRSIHLRLPINI